MNYSNFPYYPEPLNQPETQKEEQKNQESQKESNSFANIFKNLDNLSTNNLLSSLLSSGMFANNSNPLMMQALTKILSTKQEKTKKEGSSPPCTFEDL